MQLKLCFCKSITMNKWNKFVIRVRSFSADEFVVETVVSSNEMLSEDPAANTHPFSEAVVSKGPAIHNAYVAAGTFITAIFIVAIVVS